MEVADEYRVFTAHPFAFNTAGIEIMKLDPAIDGIETDSCGEPTGFVTDPAFMEVADNLIELFTDEELLKDITA